MKKITFRLSQWTMMLLFVCTTYAQVGIGTASPDLSSMLDVSSTTKGMLTPRMTTTERNAIATPADGLIVYDTTLKSFYYYNGATSLWTVINSGANGRLKFKRIKSTDVLATVLAAEKTAGGANYKLFSDTYYEINGTILVDAPIELNNAYLVGLDANSDVLFRNGNLFVGSTGGTIKNITISVPSGNVFTLSGVNTENFIVRDCIIASCANVGTISGFGLVFFAIVQYSGNTTGITYDNITRLLLSNTAWFGNNLGTFEKFTGTFSLIQKQGGFCEVNGAAIGVDVSTAGLTITGDAVMETVVFTGTVGSGMYVKGYTTGNYPGYNFNNSWNVRCSGIPNETDANSIGEFSIDYAVGSGASTTFNTVNPSNTVKVSGVSSSTNLYRFSTGAANNKLVYLGKKKRFFQVTGSISFQVSNPGTYIIYVAKNGAIISQNKIYGKGLAASDIIVLPLDAIVELSTNDFVEVFAQRYSGGTGDSIITPNMTLIVR